MGDSNQSIAKGKASKENPMPQDLFKWYIDNQDELVKQYNGKFLVIGDNAVKGAYNSDIEAFNGHFVTQSRVCPTTGKHIGYVGTRKFSKPLMLLSSISFRWRTYPDTSAIHSRTTILSDTSTQI